jgi:transcriptional regulator with XRE-family HTH domain
MTITGKMLKLIRAGAGHTQQGTADKLGYSLSFVCKVEQGLRKMSKQAALRIVLEYKLDAEQLDKLRQLSKELEQAELL